MYIVHSLFMSYKVHQSEAVNQTGSSAQNYTGTQPSEKQAPHSPSHSLPVVHHVELVYKLKQRKYISEKRK